MYQTTQTVNNEEIIALQAIEKDLSLDPVLQNICKTIGSQNQNPRLLVFLSELFKALFNSYVQSEQLVTKTIRILNQLLNRRRFQNKEIQQQELTHFINQKYHDVLANFYEKAFLKGSDEARKHMTYFYHRKIVYDFLQQQPQNQNQQLAKSIISKMDAFYQTFTGQSSEFEYLLIEQFNENESELFVLIVQDDQSKTAKQTNTMQDRFIQTLTTEIQEKFKTSHCDDLVTFKEMLVKEKQNNQSLKQAIDRIQGFIFVDKLNSLVNQHYITCQVQKIKERKSELQRKMAELEKDTLDPSKDYKDFLDISNVKYLYKSLKLKKINVQRTSSFSFRTKLTELMKQEINQIEWPKKCKSISSRKQWLEVYRDIYNQLPNDDTGAIFQLLINIQQVIINFLKYRWNYLYLFCVLIVEANLETQDLEKLVDIVFEMMQSTPKANLNMTFEAILQKLVEKSQIQINFDFQEKNAAPSQYSSLMMLENQLILINNKVLKLFLRMQNKPPKLFDEILKFESNLISECNESLRSYKKIYEKITDSIVDGEKEEKELKTSFLRTFQLYYYQKILTLSKERSSPQQSSQFQRYSLSAHRLKNDYQRKALQSYQEILAREEKICNIIEQFFAKEIERTTLQLQQQPQQMQMPEIKDFLVNFTEIFIKDNPFVFYMPSLIKCFIYMGKKIPSFIDRIDRVKYAAVAFKDKDQAEITKFIEAMCTQKETSPFEYQYKIAQSIYNFYITQPYIVDPNQQNQYRPWQDPFPSQIKDIQELNSPQYNTMCVFTSKLYSQDIKTMIKSEEQLRGELIKRINQFVQDKTTMESYQTDSIQPNSLAQNYQDLKFYKSMLIKEAQQSNDPNITNKYCQIFLKTPLKMSILTEVMDFKKQNKINFNDIELFNITKQFWNSAGQAEIKNVEISQKKKLEEYFKQLFQSSSQAAFYERVQKDCQNNDPLIKQTITKHFQKYAEELDKVSTRVAQFIAPTRQPILQMQIVGKKLNLMKLDQKYKDFVSEDQQVLNFINEQFSLYMKQLLGKVLQAVLTQKPGYEFKVYQNKPISQNEALQQKYKQQLELQAKYGPQKNSQLDTALLVSTENKTQLFYELCDYTPVQRQVEFRNFLTDVEPHLEEKLKNKIRKSKWKDEHPELEDILKKRIKRGAELWNQVQDFLCKRETNDYLGESEDESEKIKREQQQQADNIDDESLDMKILELQRASEKQLVSGKNNIKTRLNNIENDNHLLTQKAVTVKTLQFVLEQHPYFKKSKVLYKSYIL